MLWGSNVPQTRTPDAHFYTEARYKGAKSVVITPDYSRGREVRRPLAASRSRAPTRRWPWPWATSSCRNSIVDRQAPYFADYCPPIHRHADAGPPRRSDGRATCPSASCAPPISTAPWARPTIRNGRRSPSTSDGRGRGAAAARSASAGARRASGTSRRRTAEGAKHKLCALAGRDATTASLPVAFPYFGGSRARPFRRRPTIHGVLIAQRAR